VQISDGADFGWNTERHGGTAPVACATVSSELSRPAAHLRDQRDEAFCYLTTTGRVSGRPHRIEIWFFEHAGALYLLSGGGDSSDWVANLRRHAVATLRVGDREGPVAARVVDDPEEAIQPLARAGPGDTRSWRAFRAHVHHRDPDHRPVDRLRGAR
jgi:deazaflavin-dependent oxidoreductase (nitroreductase family)